MPNLSEWDKLHALAMQHREGWRTFHADEDAEIRYEIAPLPDGRVAMQMTAAYLCGDNHRVTIPWRLYQTRHQALRAFLDQAQGHFAMQEICPEQKPVQKRMLALLKGVDAGFEEPEPEPPRTENATGAHEPLTENTLSHVDKVKAAREKPVQRELF